MDKRLNLLQLFIVGIGFMLLPPLENFTNFSFFGENDIGKIAYFFSFIGFIIIIISGTIIIFKTIFSK